jgi:gamma-glutamylcyclotransferase (GGCT)/AIG2-like uncharacterized protein YtfP
MHSFLTHYGEYVADATCPGKLYKVDYYPGLVPSDDPRDIAYGEVYKLSCPGIVLSHLDDYEECGPKFSKPTQYERHKENVTTTSGEVITAWVYIYNRPTEELQLIESGDYLKVK